jgi:hypothetical protein
MMKSIGSTGRRKLSLAGAETNELHVQIRSKLGQNALGQHRSSLHTCP